MTSLAILERRMRQMTDQMVDPGLAVVGRLRDAMNEHDLEALVDVFDPDFVSETPAHPQPVYGLLLDSPS